MQQNMMLPALQAVETGHQKKDTLATRPPLWRGVAILFPQMAAASRS